jgi:site-specific recombinase XerD
MEDKLRFLEDYTESTNLTYKRMLHHIAKFEHGKGKDLYQFSSTEIKDMLKAFNFKHVTSVEAIFSVINQYFLWARRENYITNDLLPTTFITHADLEAAVSVYAQQTQYLNDRDEYWGLVNFCESYQDKAIIVLSYNSASNEEIRNLKRGDCYEETNTIILTKDDGSKRLVEIELEEMNILLNAAEETVYSRKPSKKGKDNSEKPKEKLVYLTATDYIVRPTYRHDSGIQISSQAIFQRMKRMSRLYKKPNLQLTNIYWSGVFHALQDIEKDRQLTNDDYTNINEKYNLLITNIAYTRRKYEFYKRCMQLSK